MPEDEIVLFTKGCHSSPRLTPPNPGKESGPAKVKHW